MGDLIPAVMFGKNPSLSVHEKNLRNALRYVAIVPVLLFSDKCFLNNNTVLRLGVLMLLSDKYCKKTLTPEMYERSVAGETSTYCINLLSNSLIFELYCFNSVVLIAIVISFYLLS